MKLQAIRYIFYITLFIGLSLHTSAQTGTSYSIGNRHKIYSKILQENRSYILELPSSYATSTKKYPLLVLLDGEVNYHSHSGILKHMTQARQIPEMIVVAITNIDRVRDYTPTRYLTNLNGSDATENHKTSGGSENFLAFMEQELLPHIEKEYRVNGFKTLVGISHGGLLVGSSFLSKQSSFHGFVAMDPSFWWDDQYVVKQLESTPLKQLENKRIYISTADTFENFDRIPHVYTANVNAHELFNTCLKNKGISPSHVSLEYFKKENHWTVALMSLYQGMQFIFKDVEMKHIRQRSLEEIIRYYKLNYNGAFSPPERIINTMGYQFMENNLSEALRYFVLNTQNYPTSSNAFDSLGEVYLRLGDKKKALKSYRRSYELNRRNENALEKIQALKYP